MNKNKLASVLLVIAVIVLVSVAVSACVVEPPVTPVTFTVTFNSDGGSAVASQTVDDGKLAVKPAAPTKEGYDFLGWYLGDVEYKFDTAVSADITLVAHWQAKSAVVTHTVTFDTDGGSAVQTQIVEHGKTVAKPVDPTKEGYNFTFWYNGALKYDFATPVTADLTLTAEWDEKVYVVTFDTNGGSAVESKNVPYGYTVERPDNPTKAGNFFAGWYVDADKYDFTKPVKGAITITAHWVSTDIFANALAADYSNFTSVAVFSEGDASYTNTYKQADNLAYWSQDGGSGLYQDHIVVFSDDGKMLAMYYLDGEQWVRSNLTSYADFVVALYLDEIELTDVEYVDGVYRVVDESLQAVTYALFRSTEQYDELYIELENGRISAIVGSVDGIVHTQTFDSFGTTTIAMPDIPAVQVQVEVKNRQAEIGKALNADELIKLMFAVKADGKDFAISLDMVSFGNLNLENPAEGEYTVTLTFKTWDGVTHTETAKVTVQAYGDDETFAQIFAKDYSNMTMAITTVTSSTSQSTIKIANNVYRTNPLDAFFFVESDGTLTKYQYRTYLDGYDETPNNWYALPRIELLFALNVDLFEQVDNSNVYIAKNKQDILPVIQNALAKNNVIDQTQDYAITLTVELGRISKIKIDCAYKITSAGKATAFSMTCVLSDFGTTEIEIPQQILDMRTPSTAEQTATVDNKRYVF